MRWLALESSGQSQRLELSPNNPQRLHWSLPTESAALQNIRHDVRYELQVIDEDDLSPLTPLRGTIRIRPDQPPTGLAETVHRIVLPSAEPVIAYRASDDFGISKLARLTEAFAARFQDHQQLTRDIATALQVGFEPEGCAVTVRATYEGDTQIGRAHV